jgi:hypothetical protein
MRRRLGAVWMLVACAAAPDLRAADDGEGAADRAFAFRTSIKAGLLVSRTAHDPLLFRERNQATSFWRLRLEPTVRFGEQATATVAYEHRLRVFSTSAALDGLGVLPFEGAGPYRVRALAWPVSRSSASSWTHEIDRASLALHLRRAEVTLGRQAIGWGRGVLFGAVDLFSPFTPLEADREWRRGVDAVRADVRLADRTSLDLVAAFGGTIDASAFAGRLRGYAGRADLEVMGGRRGRDLFAGLTSSAALGEAEVHGEVALFRAPESLPTAPDRRTALKAVAGGSYRFAVGSGLLVHLEYHYSGFGARSARAVVPLLADPAFRDRYRRADSQILGRHALGALASLELSPELTVSAQWLQSPVDGSGLVAPSASLTWGDKVSLLATGYVAYGRGPRDGRLRSEYGATPLSAYVQVRIYE